MGFKANAKAKKAKAEAKAEAKESALRDEYGLEISDYPDPDHYRQIIRYGERLDECGPFDLDFFPDDGVNLLGCIYPCYYHEYEGSRALVDKCVRHAIAYAKKEKKMELEDPKVVKANHQIHSGWMYYITFEAKDKRSGKRQLYDAKVLYGFTEFRGKRLIDVRLIRVKNSQKKSRGY